MKTIAMPEIERLYHERDPKGHWFDEASVRFFRTHLPARGLQAANGVVVFVTSEIDVDNHRRYNVRRMDARGHIDTVGDYCHIDTHAQAVREAAKVAQLEELQ